MCFVPCAFSPNDQTKPSQSKQTMKSPQEIMFNFGRFGIGVGSETSVVP